MAVAKTALRGTMRQRRDAVPVEVAARAAKAAANRLLSLAELDGLGVVALYAAMGSELSTGAAAAGLRDRGIALAYPRVVPGQRRLVFHRVDDASGLRPGTFGIPEPEADAPVVPVERVGAFVVPGLAFDLEGWRLGWGAGHYDATLASSRALRIGFGYELQIVHQVPHGDFDLPMDLVVTEAHVHRTPPPGSGAAGVSG